MFFLSVALLLSRLRRIEAALEVQATYKAVGATMGIVPFASASLLPCPAPAGRGGSHLLLAVRPVVDVPPRPDTGRAEDEESRRRWSLLGRQIEDSKQSAERKWSSAPLPRDSRDPRRPPSGVTSIPNDKAVRTIHTIDRTSPGHPDSAAAPTHLRWHLNSTACNSRGRTFPTSI